MYAERKEKKTVIGASCKAREKVRLVARAARENI